jgi:hypothetical protein
MSKKLNTEIEITYKKNGDIKTLTSVYDKDQVINQPIMYNLTNKFK